MKKVRDLIAKISQMRQSVFLRSTQLIKYKQQNMSKY